MKALVLVFALTLTIPLPAFATAFNLTVAASCQTSVERQAKISQARANLATKQEALDGLYHSPLISPKDRRRLASLVRRPEVVVFSFNDDFGLWLSLAHARSCRILKTLRLAGQ